MPRYKITSPDGRTFTVTAPEGTTKEQVLARIQAHAKANPKPAKGDWKDTVGGTAGNFLEGALPGSSGFLRGVREMAINAAQAPFSGQVDFEPMKAYSRGQAFQNARNKRALEDSPTATSVAQGAGMVGSLALPAAKIAKGATMLQKMKAGAATGASYGALTGAMSSHNDTLSGKGLDALSGSVVGLGFGAGFPIATRIAGAAGRPLKPYTLDPLANVAGKALNAAGKVLPKAPPIQWLRDLGESLTVPAHRRAANVQIDDALRSAPNPATGQNFTPLEVADEVARRHEMGVPAAAADVHEGARRAFGAAARTPGPALSSVRKMIDQRQQETTARVADHIAGTLGPIVNVDRQAEELMDAAKRTARPLYDLSDAQSVPFTPELQELLQRPSANDAMQVAGRQILDRGEKPYTFGLTQDAEGVFRPTEWPTMPLYDRMKTVLDKTVYDGSKPLAAPEVTRASDGAMAIRSRLLQLMDGPEGLNPHWKPARDAYGGPVQSKQALELGEQMARAGGDDIANRVRDITPSQLDFFRLGHRSGLAEDIKAAGDWSNVAAKVAGNRKKREGLYAAHGDLAGNLLDRTAAEHEANQTFQAIRGNSQTADRLAEMASQDARIEGAATGVLQALTGRPGVGLGTALRALGSGEHHAGEIKGRMAEVLGGTDPKALRESVLEIMRDAERKSRIDQTLSQGRQRTARSFSDILGAGLIEPTSTDPESY